MRPTAKIWWHSSRPHSLGEIVADAVVHGVGLVVALVAGAVLLTLALVKSAPVGLAALFVYVLSLVILLSVSMTFNLLPRNGLKQIFARLDQAAIFLLIAGTYTPFLALIWDTPIGVGLTAFVWGAALVGIALKLIVPQHFGRVALLLYLAIGWSGIFVFHSLAAALPASALWLMVAGGLTYSFGIIFHLWEKMKYHKAVWHVFVVCGAMLHLVAIFNAMGFLRW
ncbi:MAG TPA: hemolysin III family protein [Devosia sp.]|nr:hemolysin III family protein [Devosia sp.]